MALTRLDELLRHQTSNGFDVVSTSDARFFDRHWYGIYDPAGRMALVAGIGQYSNTNVQDGFAAVQTADRRQHNLRVSRALRPAIDETAVGGLQVSVVEPFTRLRLTLDRPDHDVAFALDWKARFPPVEEPPYQRVRDGRSVEDYRRYHQLGRADGWISVAGERIEVDGWWAGRDHSWGVRPGMGGPEPVTGPPDTSREQAGYLAMWFPFATDDMGGFLQLYERGDGVQTKLFGVLQRAGGDAPAQAVSSAQIEFRCYPGTRRFSEATARMVTADGTAHSVEATPLIRSWSMDGTGYDGGWDDGLGLGVHRGELRIERDVYDLADPELVRRPDGSERRPRQRETPVALRVDGRPGTGHLVIMTVGPLPRHGLG